MLLPSFDKLTDGAEQLFKTSIRYVAAVNQTRAKVVLDPIYETVAARLLSGVPLSPELLSRQFEENSYPTYRALAKKLEYSVEDMDFSQARPDLLTPRQRVLMHTFALGESSFSAAATFLNAFRDSLELSSFFGLWFVEELNHHWGFHKYLGQMGEGWEKEQREARQDVEFSPYGEDWREVAAANLYQELAAYLVYRSFATQVRDPFLAKLVSAIAKDELRHYKFYEDVVAREIKKDPSFRKIVLKHFFKATSPVNQMSQSSVEYVGHLTRTAFYIRKPEYDFMLKKMQYLLGRDFDGLLSFFYRKHMPPCALCEKEIFLCSCEDFEHLQPSAQAAA